LLWQHSSKQINVLQKKNNYELIDVQESDELPRTKKHNNVESDDLPKKKKNVEVEGLSILHS
jgi:hypothetical protein